MANKKQYVLFIVILIVYFILLKYMFHIAFPVMMALFVYYSLRPILDFIDQRFMVKRNLIGILLLLVLYAIVIVLLIGLGFIIFMTLEQLIERFPVYYQNSISPLLSTIQIKINEVLSTLGKTTMTLSLDSMGQDVLIKCIEAVSTSLQKIPGFLFSMLLFVMLSFYMFIDYDEIMYYVTRFVPKQSLEKFISIKNHTMRTLNIYLRTQLTIFCINFMIMSISFSIIRLPHPFVIATLGAIMDFLPLIGVGLVMVPQIIYFIIQGSLLKAVYLILIYIFINLIRGMFEPYLMRKSMKIPSLLIIVSLVIHLYIFGFVGVILSPIHLNLFFIMLESMQRQNNIEIENRH